MVIFLAQELLTSHCSFTCIITYCLSLSLKIKFVRSKDSDWLAGHCICWALNNAGSIINPQSVLLHWDNRAFFSEMICIKTYKAHAYNVQKTLTISLFLYSMMLYIIKTQGTQTLMYPQSSKLLNCHITNDRLFVYTGPLTYSSVQISSKCLL